MFAYDRGDSLALERLANWPLAVWLALLGGLLPVAREPMCTVTTSAAKDLVDGD